MNVVITLKDIHANKTLGGIGNYYKCIEGHLKINKKYHFIGSRYQDSKPFTVRMLEDYYKLNKELNTANLLVLNPSLSRNCIYRDGISALIGRNKKKKIIVFFHGWNPAIEDKINDSIILKKWLNVTLMQADHIIVLSHLFKNKLRTWGYHGPISVESTLVDESLIDGSKITELKTIRKHKINQHLLYLGNVSSAKGVWEIIDAFKHLSRTTENSNMHLTIAGEGKDRLSLQNYANNLGLPIHFTGYVKGDQKRDEFKSAHIYVFPSKHEGMPLSVLEAMAFGLPIITTRVGGIPDFFEEGKMGLFLDNREPKHIAEKILYLLNRPELMKEISHYNYEYAKKHFYSKKVARRLENIIDKVIE